MATEVQFGGRRFYIISEPDNDQGWTAQVLEVFSDTNVTRSMGIETSGSTRSEADERAYGVLQHRLRDALAPRT
jgi:hypothetical protein